MAGFFNTSWDLGNMFASPFANNQMVGGNLPTEITPRPGSEGPGMMPTNTGELQTPIKIVFNQIVETNQVYLVILILPVVITFIILISLVKCNMELSMVAVKRCRGG